MKNNITPAEISEWFRDRAKMFNHIASTVDDTFKSMPTESAAQKTLPHMEKVTAEAIRGLVKTKQMRIATIATQLSADPLDVQKIIQDPESGLVTGKKGWITLKEI